MYVGGPLGLEAYSTRTTYRVQYNVQATTGTALCVLLYEVHVLCKAQHALPKSLSAVTITPAAAPKTSPGPPLLD